MSADVSGGRSTPTPDERLHNPWDASCSRNGFGEPSREGERCLVCFPARPPVGDTTGTDESIRYSDGLPVVEQHRSDFEMRAIGAHARNDWEQERRALDALHLLDIAERDRGDTTQPQPTDDGHGKHCAGCRELALLTAVAEIRALHQSLAMSDRGRFNPDPEIRCMNCGENWPCRTVAILDEAGCP